MISAFSETLRDGGKLIERVLSGDPQADIDGAATASIGRLLSEYVKGDRKPDFDLNPEADAQLAKTFEVLRGLQLTVPIETIEQNGGILPTRIQGLFDVLSQESNLDEWLPIAPFDQGCYERLRKIFELLHRVLHGKTNLEFKFDVWLAFRWVHQDSLQEIIDSRVQWRRSTGQHVDVPDTIRKIIRRIERVLRFSWVRSLRAYHDVISLILRSRGRSEDADHLKPLYLFLEFGACDRSILSLISLGFSRTASLILRRLVTFPRDASPETCRETLLSRNLAALKVPVVIQREAEHLIGRLPQR